MSNFSQYEGKSYGITGDDGDWSYKLNHTVKDGGVERSSYQIGGNGRPGRPGSISLENNIIALNVMREFIPYHFDMNNEKRIALADDQIAAWSAFKEKLTADPKFFDEAKG